MRTWVVVMCPKKALAVEFHLQPPYLMMNVECLIVGVLEDVLYQRPVD